MLLHRKKRQARRQFQIGDPVRLAGGEIGRLLFGADQKLRTRQNAPQRQFDAVLERAFAAAFLIEARSTIRGPAHPPAGGTPA